LLIILNKLKLLDELESDEDDIDEDGAVYLESLEDKIKKVNGDGSFNISTSIMVGLAVCQ